MPSYTEYLTPAERLDAMRIGAVMELADNGVHPDDFERYMRKSAQLSADSVVKVLAGATTAAKAFSPSAMFNAAVVTGLPLGLIMYAVHRSLRDYNKKSRRMRRELRFYEDAMHELKNNYQVAGRTEGL